MLYVKIKYRDGSTYQRPTATMGGTRKLVRSIAHRLSEDLWTGNIDKVFPLYWEVISEDRQIVAQGLVDEDLLVIEW